VRESSDAVDYECRYSVRGSVLTIHRALKIKEDALPLDAWAEYHRIQTTVNASVAGFVKLSRTGGSMHISRVDDRSEAADSDHGSNR
jgi:hypothetical protein